MNLCQVAGDKADKMFAPYIKYRSFSKMPLKLRIQRHFYEHGSAWLEDALTIILNTVVVSGFH